MRIIIKNMNQVSDFDYKLIKMRVRIKEIKNYPSPAAKNEKCFK